MERLEIRTLLALEPFSILSPTGVFEVDDFIATWEESAGAVSYDLRISANNEPVLEPPSISGSGLASFRKHDGLTSASQELVDMPNGPYWVYVWAFDEAGNYLPASNNGLAFVVATPEPPPQVVFATSEFVGPQPGPVFPPVLPSFSGAAGLDWLCTASAVNAGLYTEPWDGFEIVHHALVATPTVDLFERFIFRQEMVNTRGETIATSLNDLLDGNITNPVGYDEFGNAIAQHPAVWTGSNPNGTWSGYSAGDWDDPSLTAMVGDATRADGTWLSAAIISGAELARAYCTGPSSKTLVELSGAPTVSFSSWTSTVDEAAGTHAVDVVLNLHGQSELASDLAVDIVDAGRGLADPTADYQFTRQTLTFPAGSISGATQSVTVSITDDAQVEDSQRLWLDLANVSANGLIVRPFHHEVTITDNDVPGANSAPTADAGGPYSVSEDATVQLNASGTTDPDQDPLTLDYAWDLDGDGAFGETGAAASRGDEVGVAPTFSSLGLIPGSKVTVSLLVTDDQGANNQVTTTITVGPADPADLANVIANVIASGQTQVELSAKQSNTPAFFQAVANLSPNVGAPIEITVLLESGTTAPGQTVSVPDGYTLVVDGANGQTTFVGASPALTVVAGEVVFKNGVVLTNAGVILPNAPDAPTVLVQGGSLVLRDVLVEETTAGDRAAIEITGGTVDLGTAADPGGNRFVVFGAGEAIHNATASAVPALGNSFQIDGAAITDPFLIEEIVHHALDVDGLGLVNFVAGNVNPRATIGALSPDEGAAVTLTASFADVGSVQTHTAVWTIRSHETSAEVSAPGIVSEHLSSGSATLDYTFPDSGVYTVTLEVTDDAGGVGSATLDVTVNNVAPTFDNENPAFEVVENTAAGVAVGAVSASDPGILDTLTYRIVSGSGATAFAVDEFTGAISVADPLQLDYETTRSFSLLVEVTDGDGGSDTANVTIDLLNQASISGTVFIDADVDGQYDADEMGIDGVMIELLNESGEVVESTATSDGGFYLFEDFDPGVYSVREVQPSGVEDGEEQLGSLGGTIPANDTMQLTLGRTDAFDYIFAELGQEVSSGDTAPIGFWQNKHGQELIAQGGTALAAWLTANFGNVFGNAFVDASGEEVAAFYKDQLFKQKGKKAAGPAHVDAQFMALAFATFFTSRTLAGEVAASYGFNVTDTGIGTRVVNVGSAGAAFEVDDDSDRTILQLLQGTNNLTGLAGDQDGFAYIYDMDRNGVIDDVEAGLRTLANDLFASINEQGGI